MYKMMGVRAEFSWQVLSFAVFARFFLMGNSASVRENPHTYRVLDALRSQNEEQNRVFGGTAV